MPTGEHQWITLHYMKFPAAISALQRKFETPAAPECWLFLPGQQLDGNDLPTWTSDIWCGLGIYDDRTDAEAMISAPQDHLPFLSEAVEHWHALAIPITHKGDVNWRGRVQSNSAIRVASEDPEGPLAVITSAGYLSRVADQTPRIARFAKGIEEVIAFFGENKGNVRRGVFNGGFDTRDGFTVSLWRDDKAMTQAAYWDGPHRTLMDQSRDGSMFDRSSFTRMRIVESHGSWDGDPLADMAWRE